MTRRGALRIRPGYREGSAETFRPEGKPFDVVFHSSVDRLLASLDVQSFSAVVVDTEVWSAWKSALEPAMRSTPFTVIDANEESKTLAGCERLALFFQEMQVVKRGKVLAIGGGVIQSLVQFTTFVYRQGVSWHFVPTTLPSMCDTCIDERCGINVGRVKNQAGVTNPPESVEIASEFLDSLGDDDLLCEYGEIVRLFLSSSLADFDRVESVFGRDGIRTPELNDLIFRSLEIKRGIVEADGRGRSIRIVLEYGHTFGNALHSISRHEIPRGAAVAWGCDLANFLAWRRGLLSEATFARTHRFFEKWYSRSISFIPTAAELIAATKRQRSFDDGTMENLILLGDLPWRLNIVRVPYDDRLTGQVDDYLERWDILSRASLPRAMNSK